MRRIRLHRRAQAYLRRMPPKRRQQMADTLTEVAALPDVNTHPRVKALTGNYKGWYRLRMGLYRAIFCIQEIEDDPGKEEMYVDYIGPRGGAY